MLVMPSGLKAVFDPAIGETFDLVDFDSETAATEMGYQDVSEDTLSRTIVEFSATLGPDIPTSLGHAFAETYPRRIVVYLGTYALAINPNKTQDPQVLRRLSVRASRYLSQDLVHESRHLRHFETGRLPNVPVREAKLPWESRPTELEARADEKAYLAGLLTGKRQYIAFLAFKGEAES